MCLGKSREKKLNYKINARVNTHSNRILLKTHRLNREKEIYNYRNIERCKTIDVASSNLFHTRARTHTLTKQINMHTYTPCVISARVAINSSVYV